MILVCQLQRHHKFLIRKVEYLEKGGGGEQGWHSQVKWSVIIPTISLNLWVTTSLIFYWLSMLFLVEEEKMITGFSYKSGQALVSRPVSTNDFLDLTVLINSIYVMCVSWMWFCLCSSLYFNFYINDRQLLWNQTVNCMLIPYQQINSEAGNWIVFAYTNESKSRELFQSTDHSKCSFTQVGAPMQGANLLIRSSLKFHLYFDVDHWST